MFALLLACTSPGSAGPGGLTFALPAADLGDPRAAATGFDPGDGDAVGRALAFVLPAFGEQVPAYETPMEVWALLQEETIANVGTCPYDRIDGDTIVHEGDCRSTFGYDFAGDVSERTWTEDAVDHYRLDADVEVIGDTEDAVFDRVRMAGAIERAEPEDEGVVHLDVNLLVEVEGYWEARDATDPRGAAWSSWVVSGTLEQAADGSWRTDLAADVGGAGGLTMISEQLAESDCPIEYNGIATLGEGIDASFEGVDACDACARVVEEEGKETLACSP